MKPDCWKHQQETLTAAVQRGHSPVRPLLSCASHNSTMIFKSPAPDMHVCQGCPQGQAFRNAVTDRRSCRKWRRKVEQEVWTNSPSFLPTSPSISSHGVCYFCNSCGVLKVSYTFPANSFTWSFISKSWEGRWMTTMCTLLLNLWMSNVRNYFLSELQRVTVQKETTHGCHGWRQLSSVSHPPVHHSIQEFAAAFLKPGNVWPFFSSTDYHLD